MTHSYCHSNVNMFFFCIPNTFVRATHSTFIRPNISPTEDLQQIVEK